jgi:hypothetical protein
MPCISLRREELSQRTSDPTCRGIVNRFFGPPGRKNLTANGGAYNGYCAAH